MNSTKKITQGAMMCAIVGAMLLLDRQLAGFIDFALFWIIPLPVVVYTAKQGTRYGFLWTKKYNDKCYWEGTSSSFWAGLSPYNADSIVHTDTIWIEGSGSPSYSGGLSLGESAGLSVGFSTSSSGMYENFSYQVENSYSIYIDYSYSGSIYDFSYVGQKASATFKFSNSFVVVNSESNQIIEEKSECWFT